VSLVGLGGPSEDSTKFVVGQHEVHIHSSYQEVKNKKGASIDVCMGLLLFVGELV
jgi:hypothetical protein